MCTKCIKEQNEILKSKMCGNCSESIGNLILATVENCGSNAERCEFFPFRLGDETKTEKRSLMEAIAICCTRCSHGMPDMVEHCDDKACPLYAFRLKEISLWDDIQIVIWTKNKETGVWEPHKEPRNLMRSFMSYPGDEE